MFPLQLGPPGSFELLVVGALWVVVPVVLAYRVYTDGQARGDDDAALWALATGGLAYLTFFGGFLALAVDVCQRE